MHVSGRGKRGGSVVQWFCGTVWYSGVGASWAQGLYFCHSGMPELGNLNVSVSTCKMGITSVPDFMGLIHAK